MHRHNWLIFLSLLINSLYSLAQPKSNPDYDGYIARYREIAVREMKLYRIPASITLAQGIIESNCGKSPLSVEANNHFGVKCTKEWTGESYFYDDDKEDECFRKYGNSDESYRDHSLFLKTRPRYAGLFDLKMTDYKGWAQGLKQAGYATNPEYANILIRIIEENRLYQYDEDNPVVPEPEITTVGITPAREEEAEEEAPDLIANGRILYRAGYPAVEESDYKQVNTSKAGRRVFENNGIPFIVASSEDTWETIATEFDIYSYQVFKQNDLMKTDPISAGQVLYLEPKKKRTEAVYHKYGKSDTMYSVSQLYGIKLKWLYKFNRLKPGIEPDPGTTLMLRY